MTVRVLGVRGLLSMAVVGVVAATTAGWSAEARAEDVGIVSHVKVMSDKNPDDMSSAEAWKKSYIKDGMTDQEKAIAVWRTVTKYRHQDNPPNEGIEYMGNVHEPFKTFNVYGYGMCCCAAADEEGLNRYLGLPARGRIINAHSVPEVWYDGQWHLLDASLMFYLKKPDGVVPSVDEMKKSIADFVKEHPGKFHGDNDWKAFGKDEGWKKGPALFATCEFYDKDGINAAGWHGWWSNMSEYNWKQVGDNTYVVPPDTKPEHNVFDYGAIMGYQVNVELREGEKLTRRWYAKEAATGMNRASEKRFEMFLDGDRRALGLQAKFGDLAPGRVGNGTLEYDVMADSKLAIDAATCENLKVEGGKIRIMDASKPATLIVRMPCSYLYLNGEMTSKPVVGEGGSVKASISVNNGLDWQEVCKFDQTFDKAEAKTDLKPQVYNKYDYRVKLEFAGAGTGLDGLKFVSTVQHSQAPLPIITDGDNTLTFTAAPVAEGTMTVQGAMNPGGGKEPHEDLGKPLAIADFHPVLDGLNMKFFGVTGGSGSGYVPVTTPGDITRLRLGIHWRAREEKDGYTITASFDEGKTWKAVGKLDLANPGKSTYIVFSDVPAGSRTVQVKFDGTQKNTACIFDLRMDVDYKEPAGGFRPVKVTYTWEEGVPAAIAEAAAKPPVKPVKGQPPAPVEKPHGTLKTAEHICNTPTDTWTINCGAGTVAKSYTVELVK